MPVKGYTTLLSRDRGVGKFETGLHSVALTVTERIMKIRIVLNLQTSSYFYSLSILIKGVHHHAWILRGKKVFI